MGHGFIMDNKAYNGRHHLVWLHHTWNTYQHLPPTYMENVCGNPAPTKEEVTKSLNPLKARTDWESMNNYVAHSS